MPNLTAGLALKYNYRDKLLLKTGVDVYGPRDFDILFMYTDGASASAGLGRTHVDMQFDVYFGAEYNISKRIGVFLEGRNLANQRILLLQSVPRSGHQYARRRETAVLACDGERKSPEAIASGSFVHRYRYRI